MAEQQVGVLVMAYGTPRSEEDIESYYAHIRGGRRPSSEYLEELRGRYQAIGGLSPLLQITQKQAQGIERALHQSGGRHRVYVGMKHAQPFLEDAIERMQAEGVERAAALVLAPHYSKMSVGSYFDRVREKVGQARPRFHFIENWHLEPEFVEVLGGRVREALEKFPEQAREDVHVIFSAHSLPEKVVQQGDPYMRQLHETGDAVAKKLGLRHWRFAWQSAGRTQDAWLGPDIRDVLREEQQEGHNDIVVCPCGFVADHLEVLYDIDIEAQQLARQLGVSLVRTRSMNDDPQFTAMLAGTVRRHLGT